MTAGMDWDEVWAEYDARQPAPRPAPAALPRRPVIATTPAPADRPNRAAPRRGAAFAGFAMLPLLVAGWIGAPYATAWHLAHALDGSDAAGLSRHVDLAAIQGAHLVFSAGAASSELLREDDWASSPTLEVLCDANATPPLGIAGIGMGDKAVEKHGKIVYGALGFGNLKLAVHRACVGKLFEAADQVFDAEQVYAVAKGMV